ncbi:ZIP family metal transporter [Candidatus Bipolaricaulota bacterium]|nr:ZIP family metal transporter [Candidatus Bipolaricaulota bacterium]
MEDQNVFIWIVGFALSAAFVNSLGILTIFLYKDWAQRAKTYFICLAAGMLISTPLMLSLPKALEKNGNAGFAALAGFLFMFFSNRLIRHRTQEEPLAFGITAVEGIGIHSLVDGIIYVVTFKASVLLGVVAGLGLVIHEFAEGIITYTALLKGKVREKTAMLYAFLIAGLTTPIGAFIVFPFVEKVGESSLGLLLGFTSGVLIYVSASHLLPEAREVEKKHSLVAFLFGVGIAGFIVFTKLI